MIHIWGFCYIHIIWHGISVWRCWCIPQYVMNSSFMHIRHGCLHFSGCREDCSVSSWHWSPGRLLPQMTESSSLQPRGVERHWARAQGSTISCIGFSRLTCDSPHSPVDPRNTALCTGLCPPPVCICCCFPRTAWAGPAPPLRHAACRCNIRPQACASPRDCRWGERFWQYRGGEAVGRRGSAGCLFSCCGCCCRCGGTLPLCSSQVSSASTSSGFPTAPEKRGEKSRESSQAKLDVWQRHNVRMSSLTSLLTKQYKIATRRPCGDHHQWVTPQ